MTASAKRSNPSVSVVIPVYADPHGLRTTLESIVDQQYSSFEIIVAVTPSSGETIGVAKEYASDYPSRIQIVEVKDQGRARARNAGINKTKGDIIAFVDADIRMKPRWLDNAVSNFEGQSADYLACNVIINSATHNESFLKRYDRALSIPVRHYIEEYQFAPTAALLLSRGLIEDVGVFDPELKSGEDREFGNRVYESGYDLKMGGCEVFHPPRRTFSEQVQKAIRIGIGTEQLRQRYPERYSVPSLLSPISYAPPRPKRLKLRMASNGCIPGFFDWIPFYPLNYILKLCQQYGRWKQNIQY